MFCHSTKEISSIQKTAVYSSGEFLLQLMWSKLTLHAKCKMFPKFCMEQVWCGISKRVRHNYWWRRNEPFRNLVFIKIRSGTQVSFFLHIAGWSKRLPKHWYFYIFLMWRDRETVTRLLKINISASLNFHQGNILPLMKREANKFIPSPLPFFDFVNVR